MTDKKAMSLALACLAVRQDGLEAASEALRVLEDALDAPLMDERVKRNAPGVDDLLEALLVVAVPESAAEARAAWHTLDEGRATLDLLSELNPMDVMEPLTAMDVREAAHKAALALDALADGREAQLALLGNVE